MLAVLAPERLVGIIAAVPEVLRVELGVQKAVPVVIALLIQPACVLRLGCLPGPSRAAAALLALRAAGAALLVRCS